MLRSIFVRRSVAQRTWRLLSESRQQPPPRGREGWLQRVPVPSRTPAGRGGEYRHFRQPVNEPRETRGRNVGLAVALLAGGYYVSHLERAPYTGRRRMIDISRAHEVALGNSTFEQLLQQHAGQILPNSDPDAQRVRKIGVRIARAVKRERPELLEGFQWRFVVVHAPGVVNALCAPGGKVIVYSGLLDLVHSDDDALAAVMGHEISHAVLRHSAERLSFMKIIFALQMLLYVIVDFGGVTALLVNLVLDLPYSRKLEREADVVGLRLMTDACYDPAASPRMFQLLADATKQAGGEETRAQSMVSTHPMFKDRIKLIRKDVPDQQTRFGDMCQRHVSPAFGRSPSGWA